MHNTKIQEIWSIRGKAPEANVALLNTSLRPLLATVRREKLGDFQRGSSGEFTVVLTSVADHKAIMEMIQMSGFEIIPQPMLARGTMVPQNLSETLAPQVR